MYIRVAPVFLFSYVETGWLCFKRLNSPVGCCGGGNHPHLIATFAVKNENLKKEKILGDWSEFEFR